MAKRKLRWSNVEAPFARFYGDGRGTLVRMQVAAVLMPKEPKQENPVPGPFVVLALRP